MSRQENVKTQPASKPKVVQPKEPTIEQRIEMMRKQLSESEGKRLDQLERSFNILKKLRMEENIFFVHMQKQQLQFKKETESKIAEFEARELQYKKQNELNRQAIVKLSTQIKSLQSSLNISNNLPTISEVSSVQPAPQQQPQSQPLKKT